MLSLYFLEYLKQFYVCLDLGNCLKHHIIFWKKYFWLCDEDTLRCKPKTPSSVCFSYQNIPRYPFFNIKSSDKWILEYQQTEFDLVLFACKSDTIIFSLDKTSPCDTCLHVWENVSCIIPYPICFMESPFCKQMLPPPRDKDSVHTHSFLFNYEY